MLVDYNGQKVHARRVSFKPVPEAFIDYELLDGTVVHVKNVVTAIFVIDSIKDAQGNPLIQIQSMPYFQVEYPEVRLQTTPFPNADMN